ncbi:MAG: polyribonucleotide nucleotidyltransferase, partial [Janthinobacterium lividum]
MFNETIKNIEWGGKTLTLSTGKIGRQADGAVMVRMGDSVVLCTAVSSKEIREGINFFPLTVHYREMAFAAGKIPGGFFKREGQASAREALVSRLIDRPIRPLFHSSFFNETQVICTVMSYDLECSTDILAVIGASAALSVSGVPYLETVAAAKVGLIDNEFVLNPSFETLKNSKLDLVVAGTDTSVMMVESEASLLTEKQMLEAVKFGHEALQPVINMIKELTAEVGKPKWQVIELYPTELKDQIRQKEEEEIRKAFKIKSKQERVSALKQISAGAIAYFMAGDKFTHLQVELALEKVKSEILRSDILSKNTRIDNRKPNDIRDIDCAVSILPKTHGSSLFTRGETQALVVTTLGTAQDEQIIDSLDGEYKDWFMLNYIFPPYSVGEATPVRAPGRREIGHGKLAWRAINPVLPVKSQFPYSVRVVSEITACNGSSSMATVCGASMALMDAGVPLKEPIAGIAMGLIKEGNKSVILSDIIGDEDHLGDMDFKVAGGHEGITALQMDIKVLGITFEIMESALQQAKEGRQHILKQMHTAIHQSNNQVSQYAPCIQSFKIDKDKIRDVIGAGGKVIREICETTGAKIDITDDGTVSVSAVGKDKMELAIEKIKSIVFEAEIGDIFEGKVVKILDAGAFVNYMGNKDGFVHISEISDTRIESVASVLNHGDLVKVKIIGFDKGKAKLTIKNAVKDNAKDNAVKNSDSKKKNSDPMDLEDPNTDKIETSKKRPNPKPTDREVSKERKY